MSFVGNKSSPYPGKSSLFHDIMQHASNYYGCLAVTVVFIVYYPCTSVINIYFVGFSNLQTRIFPVNYYEAAIFFSIQSNSIALLNNIELYLLFPQGKRVENKSIIYRRLISKYRSLLHS